MSQRILDQKMEDVLATDAAVLSVANPGCQMQIEAGLRTRGSGMKVEHIAETLLRGYRQNEVEG
jgi:glycolate oxidase iron-sulfur subunit